MELKTIHAGQVIEVNDVPIEKLGTLRYSVDGKKKYRYVKVVTSTLLQGEVCYQADLANFEIYNVHNDYSVDSPLVAGVAIFTIPLLSYGWIQVNGWIQYVREDGSVALKDPLIGDTDDHGEADTMAATEEHLVFGFAFQATTTFTDDNGSTGLNVCQAILHNCLFN